MKNATEFIEQALRVEIRSMLETLPVNQQELFTKCLEPGKTLDTTKEEKLKSLFDLCLRSVKKQQEKQPA